MARTGINFEQVAAVADALVGEGQHPTIRAVRERLGTGSPNTVHMHLTAWREARPVATVAVAELPQALSAAIATEIERAAARARAEIEAKLVQTQIEAVDLATAGEAFEIEAEDLRGQVAMLTTERDMLAGKAAQQAADLAEQAKEIQRERAIAETARVELAKAQLKIDAQIEAATTQTAEIERIRGVLEAEGKARINAEQQAAVLTAKLEAMTERATKAETRIGQVELKAHELAQELGNASGLLKARTEALEKLTSELEASKAIAIEARGEAKKAAEEAAELRGRLAGKAL